MIGMKFMVNDFDKKLMKYVDQRSTLINLPTSRFTVKQLSILLFCTSGSHVDVAKTNQLFKEIMGETINSNDS